MIKKLPIQFGRRKTWI